MPKGGLSYDSREACIRTARENGVSAAPCASLPSKKIGPDKNTNNMAPVAQGPKGPSY